MKNLDPNIREYILATLSDTFTEIRKFVEFKDYDKEKAVKGIILLGSYLDIELKELKPVGELIAENEPMGDERLCVRCKLVHINSLRWGSSIRLCSICRKDLKALRRGK